MLNEPNDISSCLACYYHTTLQRLSLWQWFPKNKGLVSGAVLTGFGAGGFVFNYIGKKIINPKGLQAVDGVFPQEIYDNFPVMLRKLAVIYFVMALAGGAFVVSRLPFLCSRIPRLT